MNLKPVNRMTCIETRPWLDWTTWQTPRWLTAIARTSLSQPARLAVEAGVITTATTVMDYGCGRAWDVAALTQQGVKAIGFDAFFAADTPLAKAGVVQLAFVLNVIENADERLEVLQLCYSLARRSLIVAVQTPSPGRGRVGEQITSIGTYQKYFTQADLRALIVQALGDVEVRSLGGGIVVVGI